MVHVSQVRAVACNVHQRLMHGLGRVAETPDYSAHCPQILDLDGNCYDFIPLPDDRLALVVGDAPGKGLAAALMISKLQSSLRTALLFAGSHVAEAGQEKTGGLEIPMDDALRVRGVQRVGNFDGEIKRLGNGSASLQAATRRGDWACFYRSGVCYHVESPKFSSGKQMIVRPETPEDCSAIERVHVAAFRDHPYSRQTEHLIVNALRADHALAVSLVAEADGKVVGHIAFSKIKINGQDRLWFLLGPAGVLPGHQRRGIGQELVRQGLKEIKRLGAEGCVLVGDPVYYARFGFTEARDLVFEGVPAEYCLCLPMSQQIPHGSVSHHPAFSVTG